MGDAAYQADPGARFLLEPCALAALFYRGLRVGNGLAGVVLGAAAVVIAAVIWGLFASPRARASLPLAGRLAVELVQVRGHDERPRENSRTR